MLGQRESREERGEQGGERERKKERESEQERGRERDRERERGFESIDMESTYSPWPPFPVIMEACCPPRLSR